MSLKLFVFGLTFFLSVSLVAQEKTDEKVLLSGKSAISRQTTPFVKAGSDEGISFLSVRPEKNDSAQGIYLVPLGAGENEKWRNCEIEFKFRFADKTGNLNVGVQAPSDPKSPGRQIVTVSYNVRGLNAGGSSVNWNAYQPGLLLTEKQWYRSLLKFNDNTFTVFLEINGKMVRFMEKALPDVPSVSFNFNTGSQVDLADVTVRALEPQSSAFTEKNGARIATSPQQVTIQPKPGDNTVSLRLCTGELPGCQLMLTGIVADKPIIMSVFPANSSVALALEKDKPKVSCFLDEQKISIEGFNASKIARFIRPNMEKYLPEQQQELWKKWSMLPQATKSFLHLEFRQDTTGLEMWIDGRYCGRRDGGKLSEVNVMLTEGGGIKDVFTGNIKRDSQFMPLQTAFLTNVQTPLNAAMSLTEGVQTLHNIPIVVASSANSADVGVLCKTADLDNSMEYCAYFSRTPLDGVESLHYSVPSKQYIRAHVLCAAMPLPERVPILTARLTRFVHCGRSSDAVADTKIQLPLAGEPLPPNTLKVGELKYGQDGKGVTVPLYLVEIPLDVGKIQDLVSKFDQGKLMNEPYLDFELLGKTTIGKPTYRLRAPYVDDSVKSSVRVFGVTLEASPVDMELGQTQLGNIFCDDEKPELPVTLTPHREGDYRLEWVLSDIAGKTIEAGSKKFNFKGEGEGVKEIIAPKANARNWYAVSLKLWDGDRLLVEHGAAMAMLGKDTRQAGYDSPYGQASMSTMMGTPGYRIASILSHKAGFHRNRAWLDDNPDEAKLAEWKIFNSQIPWKGGAYFRTPDPSVGLEKEARNFLDKWPHADTAMIFHESYGGYEPLPELFGKPSPATEDDVKKREHQQLLLTIGQIAGKMYREKFPATRLVVGNSGNSLKITAMLLRNKFPKAYIDAIGDEEPGQSIMPEDPSISVWFLQELSRALGYGTLPVDACYEWRWRLSLDLGETTQAEWNVRDMLLAHAFKYHLIPAPPQSDPGTVWYNNEYGSSCCMKRYPLLYPKPSYVATATLTRVLDQVKLIREVPTGSGTVYALEFDRRGEYVYAVWMPRGSAGLVFDFGADVTTTLVAFLGEEKQLKTTSGKVSLEASTAATYLVALSPVKSIIVDKFKHQAPEAKLNVVEKMSDLSRWQLDKDDKCWEWESRFRENFEQRLRRRGDFELRQAKDDEKGDCLELELNKPNELHQLVTEYTVLKLKEPVAVSGIPTTIGVWVKGNSSWGEIGWEIEDAEGERFMTGFGEYGRDWPGNCAINFEGWAFVQYPLSENAKWPHHIYNGWVDDSWKRLSGNGNKKIDYPIKITGLVVETRRKALVLTQLKEVPSQKLRFRDISVY